MKKNMAKPQSLKKIAAFSLLMLGAGLFALNTGCEVSSSTESIHIDPSAAHLNHEGQAVVLTASGGYKYRWSLSNTQLGMLNTYQGSQVVYTSLAQPTSQPEVQIVTVTSAYTDSATPAEENTSTNTTSTTAYIGSAEAYITHIPLVENKETASL